MSSDQPNEHINKHPAEEISSWRLGLPHLRLVSTQPINVATERNSLNTITASTIANYFLALANESEEPITNMKLNKLVYYTQAWHLAIFDRPLFTNEVEAWVHGPVVQAVYDTYKQFRWTPIITDELNLQEIRQQFNPEQQELLDDITEIYLPKTAYELEQLSQSEDPWRIAREGLAPYEPSNNVITQISMKNYYTRMLREKDDSIDEKTSYSSSEQKGA